MQYGSVCSGIESATVAWHPLGWRPQFFAEIDRFPNQVLKYHYPDVPNRGDITRFEEWPDGTIDLLVGGTPCQSFSIAGLRQGLDDRRGNLMLDYAAIARRYRPRWLVWENVPGVFSRDGGRDFASLLGLLSGCRIQVPPDGWRTAGVVEGYERAYGLAWRVLDAEYVRVDGFGRAVPQRRRRVFVVGYTGNWRHSAAVLFDREGLSGHFAPRRQTGQSLADTAGGSPDGSGFRMQAFGEYADDGTASALKFRDYKDATDLIVSHALRADGFDASEDGTGRGTPIVPIAFDCKRSTLAEGDVSPTLRSMNEEDGNANGGGQVAVAYVPDTSATLAARSSRGGGQTNSPGHHADQQLIAYNITPSNSNKDYNAREAVRAQSLTTQSANTPSARGGDIIVHAIQAGATRENPLSGPDGVGVQADLAYTLEARAEVQAVQQRWAVRRLTPRECERLMGFPDDYTLIPVGKRLAADGPRYKALGNSMAVNVMRWIGTRIEMVEASIKQDHPQTLEERNQHVG